ncbi:MAG: GAF domain-containing protein, partial [Deltaproteobacteria bacterium]|nr:GAF domain-containing protein [Deltaproteobacteria bacterium]
MSADANQTKPPEAEGTDFIGRLVDFRFRQDDVRRILATLSETDRVSVTEQLAGMLRKTSGLLEVARRVSDSLDIEVLLPRMVELVSEFLDAERCTIFLHDPEPNELYSRVAQGAGLSEIRFPAHLGIAGAVFVKGEGLVIQDAYADARFNQEIDRRTGYRTRDILCAPIRDFQGKVIGVAQVLNKKTGRFTEADMPLLESISSQAASAFVNAQLHQQIARARHEEAQLLEVTTAISRELQLKPLLAKIMETVTTILSADRSTLFVHDPATNELWSHVAQGVGMTEIRFPANRGIAGAASSKVETINIPDAYKDSRFNQDVDKRTGYKTDSILCMPIVNKQGCAVGVIQVLNKKGGPFSATDEKRLRAFSSQASIALENAKLFEDIVSVKNYNESILRSLSNSVITLDANGKVQKANEAALRLLRREGKPDEAVGRSIDELLGARNGWLIKSIDAVRRTGKPDVAMDADLVLAPEPGVVTTASVNLSVVPLTSSRDEAIGFMLVIDDITSEKRMKGTMARYMPKAVADKLLEGG